MAWLIVAGYVIGFLVSWRVFYVKYIDDDYSLVDGYSAEAKLEAAVPTGMMALVWPVFLPLVPLYGLHLLIVARPTPGERKAVAAKRVKELERKITEYEKTIKQDYARLDEAMGRLPVYEYEIKKSEVKD